MHWLNAYIIICKKIYLVSSKQSVLAVDYAFMLGAQK